MTLKSSSDPYWWATALVLAVLFIGIVGAIIGTAERISTCESKGGVSVSGKCIDRDAVIL